MATLPALTNDERAILRMLAEGGRAMDLPLPLRGRLALYGLVNATPEGWIITPDGRDAIDRAPSEESPQERQAARDLDRSRQSAISGKRLPHQRWSPFD
jgi:hypothetical protein